MLKVSTFQWKLICTAILSLFLSVPQALATLSSGLNSTSSYVPVYAGTYSSGSGGQSNDTGLSAPLAPTVVVGNGQVTRTTETTCATQPGKPDD